MSLLSEYSSLMQAVEFQIAKTMNTTFVDDIHEEIQKSVILNVYAKYYPYPPNNGPWVYKRRGFAGITDEEYNVLSKAAMPGDLEIEMVNIAPGNPMFKPTNGAGQPADSVENGGPWNYPLNPDPGPRPFMQPAADEYVSSGKANAAIQAVLDNIK